MTSPVITMKRLAIGLAGIAVVMLAIAIHVRTEEDPPDAYGFVGIEPDPELAERIDQIDRRMQDLQDQLARPAVPVPPRPVDDDDDLDRATIDRVRLYDGMARGPVTAHVTIVIFVDMQCPFCKRTIEALDGLWSQYPDQLRLIPKHYPVKPGSELHAQAMYSTTSEDAYWRLFDLLYADQARHDAAALRALADRAGNDMRLYDVYTSQRLWQRALDEDRAAANALAVRATPVIFINGKRFTGARTVEQLRDAIDAALAAPAP
jgi:protein-disulfide isomerase